MKGHYNSCLHCKFCCLLPFGRPSPHPFKAEERANERAQNTHVFIGHNLSFYCGPLFMQFSDTWISDFFEVYCGSCTMFCVSGENDKVSILARCLRRISKFVYWNMTRGGGGLAWIGRKFLLRSLLRLWQRTLRTRNIYDIAWVVPFCHCTGTQRCVFLLHCINF